MNFSNLSLKLVLLLFLDVWCWDVSQCSPILTTTRQPPPLPTTNQADSEYWLSLGRKSLQKSTERLRWKDGEGKIGAKNVILFLGDGMGLPTITAGRWLKRQLTKQYDVNLIFEDFPDTALIQTYNIDSPVPDSAATGTAFMCGVKTNKNVIGLNGHIRHRDQNCDQILLNQVDSVWAKAIGQNKSAGFVTTASVTDATPASSYAHVSDRKQEFKLPYQTSKCKDIARQLIEDSPGANFSVILGGGRKNFLPVAAGGVRSDGRDLFKEWILRHEPNFFSNFNSTNSSDKIGNEYALISSRTELRQLKFDRLNALFGLFSYNHMKFDKQRLLNEHGGVDEAEEVEPSLEEMTEVALRVLMKNPNGFFLLVEGAKIDKAHHANQAYHALHDLLAFEKAIQRALGMVDLAETLVVVTADHSHSFTMNGIAPKGANLFGFSDRRDLDNNRYTTLLYSTGPGYRLWKPNQTLDDITKPDYRQLSAVPLKSASHGGEDVASYAIGPGSSLLHGVQEQTFIAHLMEYSGCVGDYRHEDHCIKQKPSSIKKINLETNSSSVLVQGNNFVVSTTTTTTTPPTTPTAALVFGSTTQGPLPSTTTSLVTATTISSSSNVSTTTRMVPLINWLEDLQNRLK